MMAPVTLLQTSPARCRLAALIRLDGAAEEAIASALTHSRVIRPRREIISEGQRILGVQMIVRGWAARVRTLSDGRRQFLNFLLPGDVIGMCHQANPLAVATVTALTEVTVCPAPSTAYAPALKQAYAISQAMEEAYLLEHIVRLGRLNAQERIISLLLELHERLTLSGLASGNSFDLPLTQEVLADSLGLTSVHVNRMLQQARKMGELDWRNGRATLSDPAALALAIGRQPARVSAGR